MINLFPFQNDPFLAIFKMFSHMKTILTANTDYNIVSYWRNGFFSYMCHSQLLLT